VDTANENTERTDAEQLILVAETDGVIVGFATGGKEREGRKDADSELYAIYLLQTWQRQGLGARLTVKLAEWLASKGFRCMDVWVLERNPSPLFYERLGGALLPNTKAVEMGGQQLLEVSYRFDLQELIAQRAPQPGSADF
jgi:GNAT superfamily N-acetyltransferase